MEPRIVYSTYRELYPRFGYADIEGNTIYVRGDVPPSVREFLIDHEFYHLEDKARWWIWREIKANTYAAVRHPFGFIRCCFMSLAFYRLKYYWQRIREGK